MPEYATASSSQPIDADIDEASCGSIEKPGADQGQLDPTSSSSAYLYKQQTSSVSEQVLPALQFSTAQDDDAAAASGYTAAQHQQQNVGGTFSSPSGDKSRRVRGTGGEFEPLDPSYKVRKKDYKSFFVVGKVFSTLWTEPFEGPRNDQNETFVSHIKYDAMAFSKIRRFVIVKAGNRACTCLPVTSYQGLGVNKDWINLDEHGFIYSHKCPQPVAGMDKLPLKISLVKRTAPLRDPSLINYGRVYTVETNVKVKEVGDLDSRSRKDLLAYFKYTFFPDDRDDGNKPSTPASYPSVDMSGVGAGIYAGHSSGASYGQYVGSGNYLAGTSSTNYLSTSNPGGFSSYGNSGSTYPASPDYNDATQPGYQQQNSGGYGHNYNISISNWQQQPTSSNAMSYSNFDPAHSNQTGFPSYSPAFISPNSASYESSYHQNQATAPGYDLSLVEDIDIHSHSPQEPIPLRRHRDSRRL